MEKGEGKNKLVGSEKKRERERRLLKTLPVNLEKHRNKLDGDQNSGKDREKGKSRESAYTDPHLGS